MMRRQALRWLGLGSAGALAALASANAQAAEPPIYTGWFNKVAVSGHDPVAYFTQGKPVKGDPQFTTVYQGVSWHFSSAQNRDLFVADPARYAPQFGGYCAWAVAEGKTASADPKYWRIVDGKLYLNYDADVQKKWEQDVPGFISRATGNWPKVLGR